MLNNFLDLAQWTSLILSIAGTVYATETKQVFYAVTPLTATVCLSVIHRPERQKLQSLQERLTRQDEVIASLLKDYNTLPEFVNKLDTERSEIRAFVSSLQMTNLQTFKNKFDELQNIVNNQINCLYQEIQIIRNEQYISQYTITSLTNKLNDLEILIDRLSDRAELSSTINDRV